jgi:hypothetical protein
MQYKCLMIIKAIVCLVLGIPILFFPKTLYGLFEADLAAGGAFAGQEYAAAMLGTMFLAWFARNAGPSDARRAIILGLFVYDAIGFVITLLAVLAGTLNALGWFPAVIYLFFTAGFGYLLMIKKDKQTATLAI